MYRRILTVQDISCLGQCSMTVALPILSACGHETCVLPTAVLSTHTGGFGAVHYRDLSGEISPILAHWRRENIHFDAVYAGYLGSIEQIELVQNLFDTMLSEGGARVLDPAMADHGKLYQGFDENYVEAMKALCTHADVLIPNLTEACLLTGTPYETRNDQEFARELLGKLGNLCPCVVLTGVGDAPDRTGVALLQNGEIRFYHHEKLPKSYHGTGDIFASAFVGAWQQGNSLEAAVKIAADFTSLCIRKTWEKPAHWYGVKFEEALPELIRMLQK
jgi:pyridoxine kinase